jgi:tetratricopeptide (TPR) repeat protein
LQADPEEPRLRALKAHEDSKDAIGARPDDAQSAWELGRACFDLAEFATNNTQRAALAREGITACQHALSLNSTSAPARYYLGMNRGQLARTTTLGALKLVDRMERDFLVARDLDPTFDEAGPDRNLGLLYLQAPGWPVSVGNQGKARTHLQRAAKLSPFYPENRLNLMEAFAKWGDSSALQTEFEAWVVGRLEAEQRYAGDRWRQDWLHWDQRLDRLRGLLPELPVSEQVRAD